MARQCAFRGNAGSAGVHVNSRGQDHLREFRHGCEKDLLSARPERADCRDRHLPPGQGRGYRWGVSRGSTWQAKSFYGQRNGPIRQLRGGKKNFHTGLRLRGTAVGCGRQGGVDINQCQESRWRNGSSRGRHLIADRRLMKGFPKPSGVVRMRAVHSCRGLGDRRWCCVRGRLNRGAPFHNHRAPMQSDLRLHTGIRVEVENDPGIAKPIFGDTNKANGRSVGRHEPPFEAAGHCSVPKFQVPLRGNRASSCFELRGPVETQDNPRGAGPGGKINRAQLRREPSARGGPGPARCGEQAHEGQQPHSLCGPCGHSAKTPVRLPAASSSLGGTPSGEPVKNRGQSTSRR